MYGNSSPFSYSPRGFSHDEFPFKRTPFVRDDFKSSPRPRANMSRPSGKSIYMQRKEYSETLNRESDNIHTRVEHLFTGELDGREMKTVEDCLAKLKRLDAKGRLWPQEMIMEVQGDYLMLSDIETKAELEGMPVSSIVRTKAVLDSCAYNSLLILTVQERRKRYPQVMMFQCEETGAELLKSDLDKVLPRRDVSPEPRKEQPNFRSDLENIISQPPPPYFRKSEPPPVQRSWSPPPPDLLPPPPVRREPEYVAPPRPYTPQEEITQPSDIYEIRSSPEVPPERPEMERSKDIFNHIISDLELFLDKLAAASNASPSPSPTPQQVEKMKMKNVLKMKKSKKMAPSAVILPPWDEYISCLQKIKYGFNLLGQLEGSLTNPSAIDFVHIFFSSLQLMCSKYPPDLPPTVRSPLLTDSAMELLRRVITPEEEQLWKSLGDSWNIPRSRWPTGDVPPYIPVFYDGWQPPPPSRRSSPLPTRNSPMNRHVSQRFPPGQPNRQINGDQNYSPRSTVRRPDQPPTNNSWGPPPTNEQPTYMRAMYDFRARNNVELSLMKGEVVEVIQKNKQWWVVRNRQNEEGNVPQNVLEPITSTRLSEAPSWDSRSQATLDMNSTPSEVKAWLESKGFSKITVTSLGVLTGKLLLGMSKDEIRMVCPEEGGRVFFQLQAIKSSIALASEPSGPYN